MAIVTNPDGTLSSTDPNSVVAIVNGQPVEQHRAAWDPHQQPVTQRETFDQGPSRTAGYVDPTGLSLDPNGGVTDFSSYLLSTMTPEQRQALVSKGYKEQLTNPVPVQAPQRAYEASGGDRGTADPNLVRLKDNRDLITKQGDSTDELLRKLGEQQAASQARNQAIVDRDNHLIDEQVPKDAEYIAKLNELNDKLDGRISTANADDLGWAKDYTDGLAELNTRNDAAIDRLGGVYDDLSTPLVANLTSQAAVADPEALAGQRQALGQLQGAANGSLDYTSQAASAFADPKYLAMRDKGLEDLYGVSQGGKDVHVGQEDPEAYRATMDALHQMGELTKPQLTDQERFLYEKARQAQEMDERGLSAARMSDLRRRGMAGGGAELTQNAIDSQRISQNRVLSDLGANAQAVARATGMLQSYGSLGNNMNAQANGLATDNANRQLSALGLYTSGAETAEQQSFQQQYARGTAADKASSDNQGTRLSGMVASGNQANQMQDDAFNRGHEADVMSRYNKTFEQDERNALWGRTTDLTNATLNGSAQNSNNLSNTFKAQTQVTDNNYIRDAQGIGARASTLNTGNALDNNTLDRRIGVGNVGIGVNNTGVAQNGQLTGMQIQAGQFETAGLLGNNNDIGGYLAGEKAADRATSAAVGAAKSSNANPFNIANIANLWNGAGPSKSGLSPSQLAAIGVSDDEAARRLGG